MGNLASQQFNTQTDPDVLRRQILAEREKQLSGISNPQQQLAARLGGLLGGGAVNLAQGRGFFDINDPLLTKVSQIQSIYNDVAGRVDPTADPAKFYSELQKAYGEAGLGREALAAANEGQKARTSSMDFQIKEAALFEKNPELLAGRITTALEQGNEPEANRLANLNARLTQDRELSLEAKKTAIEKDRAYIAYQKSLSDQGKYSVQPVNKDNPLDGFYRVNQRTGEITVIPVPAEIAEKYSTPAKDNKGKPEGKLDKNKYMIGGNTTTPASSSASPMNYLDGIGIETGDATQGNLPATPVTRLTPIQERDFAIQRAMPNVAVSMLTEQQKAVLAQQLGL